MIKIDILDEARFGASNLSNHHIRHVLSTGDEQNRLDDMSEEDYNDLADELTDSSCGDVGDENDVIGFTSVSGDRKRYNKYDKKTGLFSIYTPDDVAITTYKIRQGKLQKALDGELKPEFNYAEDLPDEEKEGKEFDYGSFLSSHPNVKNRRKLNNIIYNLSSFGIMLPDNIATPLLNALFKMNEKQIKEAKLQVENELYVPLFIKSEENIAKLSIDNRVDKEGDEVDNLSLLVSRYTYKKEKILVSQIYNDKDIKAIKLSVPSDSEMKKFTTQSPLIAIIASTGNASIDDIDESKFEDIVINNTKTSIGLEGKLCYKK